MGRLSPSQIESALALQKERGGRLGALLVQAGLVRETDLAVALAVQYACPVVDLDAADAGTGRPDLVEAEFATRHQVLPWALDEAAARLTVLVADPADIEATDEIARRTGHRVVIAVAPATQLRRAILAAFGLAPPDAPSRAERRKRPSSADQSDRSALLQMWTGPAKTDGDGEAAA